MKRKYFTNRLLTQSTIWIGCAAACCSLSLAGNTTASTPAASTSSPELTNSIGLAIGGTAAYGDQAAFQRRTAQSGDFYGGISNLSWSDNIADGLTLDVEGHALFGMEDYGFLGTLTKDGTGYVQVGYKQFRTWYDGSGGFVPGAVNNWIELYDDELSVDRGEVWLETGLRLENMPEVTFRYTHAWRDGSKDATTWGGVATAAPAAGYKLVPALNRIDETTDTFRLDVTHTLGNTDFGGGLAFQRIQNDDTRVMRNGISKANSTLGTRVLDQAVYDSDIFSANLFSETRLNEQVMFSLGYNFYNYDNDIGGGRPSRSAATGLQLTGSDHALWGIDGGTQGTSNALAANLWWSPTKDISIIPSFRAELWNSDGWANHVAGVRGSNVAAAGGLTVDQIVDNAVNGIYPGPGVNYGRLEDFQSGGGNDIQEFTETLEVRYTGIENVVLYARAEVTQAESDMSRYEIDDFHNGVAPGYGNRTTESDTDRQKYSVGANWYPVRGIGLSAQAYYKDSETDYTHTGSESAFLDQYNYDTSDINFRLTWRAMPNLTLVSRYDYQQTTMESQGIRGGLPLRLMESADITSHIFSQSVTWMPMERAYLQGTVSYVDSTTDTPSTTAISYVNSDSDNDYITAMLTAGYAIDDKTDITASYCYYYADNYALPRNAAGVPAMGYGTSIEEHVFSVSLNRVLTPAMLWSLGYGYYTGNDSTSGGYNDYSAHMVSTGLQIRF